MKLRVLLLGTMLSVALVVAGTAWAQEKKEQEPKQPVAKPEAQKPGEAKAGKPQEGEMPPEMEAWMKYATPGEHHKHLDVLVGKWNQATSWRMAPDAPPKESKGTAEYKWLLGGRFLQESIKSEMMDQPFEGIGIYGYDNLKQKYTAVWMDSMGTMMLHLEGTCDPAGKVFTYTGEYDDPMTGGKEKKKKYKSTLKIESRDKFHYEMYDTGPDGKEFKTLEIESTRVS